VPYCAGPMIIDLIEDGMTRKSVDAERRAEIGRARRARTRAKIIASAFALFGSEEGLFTRVEDVADRAGITRATFYNHFNDMADLREAVTYEVTHDFLVAVINTVLMLEDQRERASAAIRFYLNKAREDPQWGWSMINLSANGIIFGAETTRQAEQTVVDGMEDGRLDVPNSRIGRDMIMGTALAALTSMLREDPGPDYPVQVTAQILIGLGVEAGIAGEIARRPLPPLVQDTKLDQV